MNEAIGLGGGFAHCASTGSYWLWIGIALFISVVIIVLNGKYDFGDVGKIIGLILIVGILAIAIFLRPADVGANTTKEQAAKGVFIGY